MEAVVCTIILLSRALCWTADEDGKLRETSMAKSAAAAGMANVNAPLEKLARQLLSVLELAETLGSVSAVCRQRGGSRTQFYEDQAPLPGAGACWPQRPATDLQEPSTNHATQDRPEITERVLVLSLEKPGWGGYKLSDYLKLQGIPVNSPTIQYTIQSVGGGPEDD